MGSRYVRGVSDHPAVQGGKLIQYGMLPLRGKSRLLVALTLVRLHLLQLPCPSVCLSAPIATQRSRRWKSGRDTQKEKDGIEDKDGRARRMDGQKKKEGIAMLVPMELITMRTVNTA